MYHMSQVGYPEGLKERKDAKGFVFSNVVWEHVIISLAFFYNFLVFFQVEN